MFHAFSGCDTTSFFFRKGKKSVWDAWKSYPDVTETFVFVYRNPFQYVDPYSIHFQHLERLTVIMYDKTSTRVSVNEARRDIFAKKGRSLENMPQSQDALLQHIKRSIYQCSLWETCSEAFRAIPEPTDWGWKLEDINFSEILKLNVLCADFDKIRGLLA